LTVYRHVEVTPLARSQLLAASALRTINPAWLTTNGLWEALAETGRALVA